MPHEDYRSAFRVFESRLEEVRAARAFAARKLTGWGLDSIFTEIIVGELSVNAISHGRSTFTVEIVADDGLIRVGVHDDNPQLPTRALALPETTNGRGLNIVESLSSSWGVQTFSGDGKMVWAELNAAPIRSTANYRQTLSHVPRAEWEGASSILASWSRLPREGSIGKGDRGGS
jgi:anti-sigma regulatory factor (Ser/Thr protein kinase)